MHPVPQPMYDVKHDADSGDDASISVLAPVLARPANGWTAPLKKPVETLAIVPKGGRIYLLARKLYNVLLYLAQRHSPETVIYRAAMRDIIGLVEFNSNNTEVIKNHLRQLVTTKVEWQSPTPGEGHRWSVSALIAHCDLVLQRGELIIEWSFAPNLKQQLTRPDRYGLVWLMNQANLRSVAALALYENCSRYVDNPARLTPRKPWEWWRPVLTGIPETEVDTYREYKYFKRDVIKNAVAEVNAMTTISLELIEHRRGRQVTDLQFKVMRKDPLGLPAARLTPQDLETVGRAIKYGVSQDQAERMIGQHGQSAVSAALNTLGARRTMNNLPPVDDPGKYLAGVLRNRADSPAGTTTGNTPTAQPGGKERSRAMLIEKFRAKRRESLLALYRDFSTTEQEELEASFAQACLPTLPSVLQRAYQRQKLQNPMVRAEFIGWFARRTWGDDWDRPNAEELLDFATES